MRIALRAQATLIGGVARIAAARGALVSMAAARRCALATRASLVGWIVRDAVCTQRSCAASRAAFAPTCVGRRWEAST
ncbi:hypothetical protein [Luteimonas terrae]|uniref:Secreted protein n=1 Tax=Luteimonas terrae TaxID=1530191 RepID=A0ABU1XXF2_9GAMM|nr:hypothetical protein [Luteimonas terrae]MDR7193449.1 hypothetical protein [Luteimonas terrae]